MGRAIRTALSLLVAASLGACGDTLVSSDATVLVQPQACSSVTSCGDGTSCTDCTASPPPANAVPACLPAGPQAYACGYECQGGLLKCDAGCCAAQEIATGEGHGCAITEGGGLSCWGSDYWGQVTGGTGDTVVLGPVRSYASGVTAVATGEAHTCAVVNGTVACWGWGVDGQTSPPAGLVDVTALAAGQRHTCAIVAGGAVRCWGSNALGQTAGGTPVASGAVAVAAGRDHTCAIVGTAGEVRCWGGNEFAQIGDGSVGGTKGPTAIASGAAYVATGQSNGCLALETPVEPPSGQIVDSVRCWGASPGTSFGLAAAQPTPGIPLKDHDTAVIRDRATGIAAGRTHVCVMVADTAEGILCFGADNAFQQLGSDTPLGVPSEALPVGGSQGSRAIAAGVDHTCAIWSNGGVRCWGKNDFGQLGTGDTVQPSATSPVVEVSGR